jgi:hypothetical protein
MTAPFEKTPDGFLTGRAIVTSCGVFSYRRADGSVQAELRLPEEVFAKDSLASMRLKPLTNDHPAELVTPETAKALQVGSLGENPSSWVDHAALQNPRESGRGNSGSDGVHIAIDVIVTDAQTIADIQAGKRALSMGYNCDIEETSGVWAGTGYTAIQRNIRYNHCAVVDAARAGGAARIHLDAAPAGLAEPGGEETVMRKINVDGVEYEGEEKLVETYVAQKKRADAAEAALDKEKAAREGDKKALSAMEASRDTQRERADAAEARVKELETARLDSKALDAAIACRVALLEAASRAAVEVKKDMGDTDIKKAVILACFPNANLDGRDEAYIQARYDAAAEALADKADGTGREALGSSFLGGAGRADSAAVRERMIAGLKERSRGAAKE